MAIKPTAAEVIEEGQLVLAYFPNCANAGALTTFIESRIDDVDAEVQLFVGSANYSTSNANIQRLLHKAEIYLACGALWQIIKNVMDSYDAESLPPEFVESDQAAANRDFYLGRGNEIIAKYEAPEDTGATLDDAVLCSTTGYNKEFQPARYDTDGNVIDGLEGTMGVF